MRLALLVVLVKAAAALSIHNCQPVARRQPTATHTTAPTIHHNQTPHTLTHHTPRTSHVVHMLLPPTTQMLAADVFGKTFLAGMAIAAAAVTSTVFIGIVVRGKYDEVEASFFDAQDAARQDAAQQVGVEEEVSGFFGNLNPTEAEAAGADAE